MIQWEVNQHTLNFRPMRIAEIGYGCVFQLMKIKLKNLLLEIDNLEGLCFIEIKLLPENVLN